jgi:hypothetical protein
MSQTFEQVRLACAMAAHEMNRVYCRALGDLSQESWDAAPEWQQKSVLEGVDGVFAGAGPEKSHEDWCAAKIADGWKYGEVKDPEAKLHPCLVPYDALPPEQRQKDHVFVATVRTMAAALGFIPPAGIPVVGHGG